MLSLNIALLVGLITPAALGVRYSSFASLEQETGQQIASEVDENANDEGELDRSEEDDELETDSEGRRKGKVGLVVVDVQDCFTEKGIGLGNPRGDATYKNNVNAFVEKVRQGGGVVVLLQDYHPEHHISFGKVATNNPDWEWINKEFPQEYTGPLCKEAVEWDNKEWYDKKSAAESSFELDADKYLPMRHKCTNTTQEITQPLFPAHCVQGTDEVKHTEGLCEAAGGTSSGDTCEPTDDKLKIVRKGMNPGIDSFGGIYDNRVVANILKDSDEKAHWGLFHFFKSHKVKHVIHIGIADDFCVKTTAFAVTTKLAKRKYGIRSASVVPSLSYGIFQQLADRDDENKKSDALIEEYKQAKVKIETEEEALCRLGGKSCKKRGRKGRGKKTKK